jgi:hypothetical protein
VFHSLGVLWEGDSPYQDDKRRPCCPIEAASAYVDRENNRYGPVRDMRDVQDEINKRRSKALHYLNTRQVQETVPGSGLSDPDLARLEASKPDGVIPTGWAVIPQTDQVQGQLELLREAKSEIERLGPNPAILGRDGADSSGRALLARQQSGLVELSILYGHLEDWELRIYRQAWARMKQYWKTPQWLRVTDDEGAAKFLQLNAPPTMPGPDGQDVPGQYAGMVDPQTGQPAAEGAEGAKPAFRMPNGQMVLGYKNAVAELDVDIILDSVPDTANVQQEQFQDLMQLVGSNPAYAQSVPFEMMLELSSVPHKRQLIDKLKQLREQNQQQQIEQQQRAQQIAEAGATAKIRDTNASADLKTAQAAAEVVDSHLEPGQSHGRNGPRRAAARAFPANHTNTRAGPVRAVSARNPRPSAADTRRRGDTGVSLAGA